MKTHCKSLGVRYPEWAIVKHDIEGAIKNHKDGETVRCVDYWVEQNCYPSEAVFVPAPDAKEEDEGVLLSLVYDSSRVESFVLVLDAKTMAEVARAYTGMRCPVTFHGQFIHAPK